MMQPSGILIFYHCPSNTGYAIGRHEPDFYKMAYSITNDHNKIHLGFTSLAGGRPNYVDENFTNLIEFDSTNPSQTSRTFIYNYVRINKIDTAFGFDQPVSCPAYRAMRKGGVRLFISYWGASMSSINSGLKLLLKKIEVKIRRYGPDHYIFQSQAMADTAIYGRGINPDNITIIPNAVDTEKFKPNSSNYHYARQVFNIPDYRKVIVYSGHMEERKGVRVIIKAANELIQARKRNDVHFLLLGNKNDEEKKYYSDFLGKESEKYITFGGYRHDMENILPSCYVGVIATTGWDSFTMSNVEMASSGLPLIVSKIQGLKETIQEGKTGFFIEPGDHVGLANNIELLLDKPKLRDVMGSSGRQRIIENFSLDTHIKRLIFTVENLLQNK